MSESCPNCGPEPNSADGQHCVECGAELEEDQPKNYYPDMPPGLPNETGPEYTDRLTGADGTNRSPYNHHRLRQCSIGWHDECSDPNGFDCECPCHWEEEEEEESTKFCFCGQLASQDSETCWAHSPEPTESGFSRAYNEGGTE